MRDILQSRYLRRRVAHKQLARTSLIYLTCVYSSLNNVLISLYIIFLTHIYMLPVCDRLQRLQNRAGRIITFSDYNRRSVDILRDLRWDSLEQRRSKQLAISVFKSLNNLYPESLKNVFKPTSGVHSYNVRGASNNVFVPRPRTEAAKRAFSYRGAVMWNGLENMLKDEVNLNSFKSALSF